MIRSKQIKAILFDSGHTLNYPRTGNWFIPPNFTRYVNPTAMQSVGKDALDRAFETGLDYLLKNHSISTEAGEYEAFREFYRIVSDCLQLNPGDIRISELAQDAVYNDDKFVFYEDVKDALDILRKHYKLGIVSDTWPSLERVFRNAGLRDYFSSFIISSRLGVLKPNRLMYESALRELSVEPEEVLFIDDFTNNIEGAGRLGIPGIHILRGSAKCDCTECVHIRDLNELVELLHVE